MKVLIVDSRGHIVISAEEVEKLDLKPDDELLLEMREDTIILKPLLRSVKVRADREWGKEALLSRPSYSSCPMEWTESLPVLPLGIFAEARPLISP